jgi:hypothetical protein
MGINLEKWLQEFQAHRTTIVELVAGIHEITLLAAHNRVKIETMQHDEITRWAEGLIRAGLGDATASEVIQVSIRQEKLFQNERHATITNVLSSGVGSVVPYLMPIIMDFPGTKMEVGEGE